MVYLPPRVSAGAFGQSNSEKKRDTSNVEMCTSLPSLLASFVWFFAVSSWAFFSPTVLTSILAMKSASFSLAFLRTTLTTMSHTFCGGFSWGAGPRAGVGNSTGSGRSHWRSCNALQKTWVTGERHGEACGRISRATAITTICVRCRRGRVVGAERIVHHRYHPS